MHIIYLEETQDRIRVNIRVESPPVTVNVRLTPFSGCGRLNGGGRGGAEAATASTGDRSLLVREELRIRRYIFTDDNTYIYCQNYEYLLLI